MKELLITTLTLLIVMNLDAQQILKESVFDPAGKANIANLKEVQVDKDNNEIRLFFLTKSTEKRIKGEVLYFDLDFNFKNNENIDEELEKVREKYKLKFSLSGCTDSKEPLLTIESNFTNGQVVFKKGYIDRYYNWNTGFCDDRFKVEEKVKPKGEAGELIKLIAWWTQNDIINYRRAISSVKYGYWSNTVTYTQARVGNVRQLMDGENGDALFLGLVTTGLRDPNTGKKYVVQKYSAARIEKITETEFEFEAGALPMYNKVLSNGNMAFVFFRTDNVYEYVEIDIDTKVVFRSKINAPNNQYWLINEISETPSGTYIHGKLSTTAYTKMVFGVLSNPSYLKAQRDNLELSKTWGYQIMKLGDNNIEWIRATPMSEFAKKFKAPASEKSKPYDGSKLKVTGMHVTKSNELLVSGQVKTKKGEYMDVVAFHFNPQGELITHYTSKLRDKNDYNKYTNTESGFLNSPSSNDTYWTIFEVAGAKKRGETARTLYYPRVSKIEAGGGGASAFLEVGKREYFLDDNFPVNYIDPETYFYLGSTKNGKNLWFAKIKFD